MRKLLLFCFLSWSISAHAALTIVICGGANHQCANNPNIPQQDSGAVSDANATGLTAGSAVAQTSAPAVNVPGASIGSLPPSGSPAAPMDPTLPVSASNPLCSTSGNQITCDGGVGPAFAGGGTLASSPSTYYYDAGGNVPGQFSTAAALCAAYGAKMGRATPLISPMLCSDASGYVKLVVSSAQSCPSGSALNPSTGQCDSSSPAVPAGMTDVQTPAQPATSSSPAVPASDTYSGTPSVLEQFAIVGNNPSGVPGSITPGTAAAASGTPSGGSGSGTCPPGAICNTAGLAQDASIQTLIQKVEAQSLAQANDVAAAKSAAAGFPSQSANGNGGLDPSKVGLPTSSTFIAPVISLDGLLPSSTTCVPIPVTILGRAENLDPCKIVTIAMPFINWAIITIGVIGGIGLILKHPKSEA